MTLDLDRPMAPSTPAATAAATDADLVARTRRGDREAADALARRCRRPAYLLALQLLRDPDDALDVAQDALLRLFTTLHRVEPGRPIRPWLSAIVRNRARDLMRRRKVRRAAPLVSDDPETGVELIDHSPGPADHAERAELKARIWRALGTLSEGQREILVLRAFQDLKYDGIAAVLRLPIGTVMSRLHRARKALREVLGSGDGGPSDG